MRTLLVVASIAVGVFSIGMIISAYVILAEDIDLSYASASPVNIEIWTDPFDEDFVRVIEQIPGVDAAEGRQISGVRTSIDGVEWQNLNLIAVTDFETMGINQLSTLAGTQYPGRRELLVSQDFMADTGYEVGDQIQVEFANGKIHTLPLVGIVGDQVTGAGDFTAGPKAYLTIDSLPSFWKCPIITTVCMSGFRGRAVMKVRLRILAEVIEDKTRTPPTQIYRTEIKVSDEHPMGSLVLAVLGVLGLWEG